MKTNTCWSANAIFVVALGASSVANAAVGRWFDCTSGSMQTASCWSGNIKPVAGDTAYIGYSSYAANVTASLTSGIFAANQVVGYDRTGTVNHSAGSNTPGYVYLGYNAGITGNYNLSGTGILSVADEAFGWNGTGNFTQTGGTHTVSSQLTLGYNAGSKGTYNLQGGNLKISSMYSDITIGYLGTGIFTQSGGNLTTAAYGNIEVGSRGTGTYNHSGGTVTNNGYLVLGDMAGGNGNYKLSGTGNLSSYLEWVGVSGIGTLTQTGGMNAVDTSLILGQGSGSNGTYTLSGGSLSVAQYATIGSSGSGTFTQSGGTYTVGVTLILGSAIGSSGIYNLNGGTLTVGDIQRGAGTSAFNFSAGTLNITGYGGLNIGSSGPLGNTQTLGAGKVLNVTKALTIDAGSSVNVSGGALSAGSASNNGTLNSSSSLNVGTGLSNAGALGLSGGSVSGNINNTGTVNVSGTVNHGGNLTQTAGTTTINGTLSTGNVDIQGGLLKGSGNIVGTLLNSGGTLAVGNSPGSMTVTGNFTQGATGLFDVELGGLIGGSQYDTLNVTGTASLGGTLNVSLYDLGGGLFSPQQGNYFDILSAEHLNGTFGTLSFATLNPGLAWHVDYLIDAVGTTDVVRLSVQPVPLPAAVWLFASGLLGLVGVARKETRA